MAFAAAGWAEQEQVGALGQPAVAGGDGHDLGEHRHGLEVEGVESLSGWQASVGEMAFDPSAAPFGEFMFGDGGEEACSGPSFLVSLFGKLRPQQLDGGQAQLVDQALSTDFLGRMDENTSHFPTRSFATAHRTGAGPHIGLGALADAAITSTNAVRRPPGQRRS
jgi:hypothetical protein